MLPYALVERAWNHDIAFAPASVETMRGLTGEGDALGVPTRPRQRGEATHHRLQLVVRRCAIQLQRHPRAGGGGGGRPPAPAAPAP
jgi:hypothetical protein